MVFGVVVILLVLLVAYFHYMQGLLSGVLSAVCAALAAALTMSFHETVIDMIAQGKMADQTHALVLVGMFVLIYLILRILMDKLVPGNVRFPAIADKVGGAAMGLIAGIFGIGILTIAVSSLPFGPSIAGYARYEVEDRDVKIPTGRGPFQDSNTYEELRSSDPIKPDDRGSGLLLPVDDLVVNFVSRMSDGGSLAGDRSFASVHPSYNDQLFFQRLGVQLGGKHTAMNTARAQAAKVDGVYYIQQVPQGEAEIQEIRYREGLKPLASTGAIAIIAVRVEFSDQATDSDKRVRMAPVGIRLVANGVNYFPEGTLDAGAGVVYANKPDDFLIIEPNKPVDFVFKVARGDVLKGGSKPNDREMVVADGVFIEVKRMVRLPLGGKPVALAIESAESGVIRKTDAGAAKVDGTPLNVAPTPDAPAAPATPQANTPAPSPSAKPAPAAPATPTPPAAPPTAAADEKSPFKFETAAVNNRLFAPVSVGKAAAEASEDVEQELNSGKAFMKNKKIAKLELRKGDETLQEIGTGTGKLTQLYTPEGRKMILVKGTPLASEAWRWADNLSEIELVDDQNGRHKPYGALARAKGDNNREYYLARFDFESQPTNLTKEDGLTPTEVHLIFIVPENAVIKSMNFQNEKVTDVTVAPPATTKPA